MVFNQLIYHTIMHNLYTIFAKFLEICKVFSSDLVDDNGNIPRRGVVPRFSDLEVISLSLTAEALGIDSENYLFSKLSEYCTQFPLLISRRQYNDRRKLTAGLCNAIREKIAFEIDGGENVFCVDSKPIEVCRMARSKRCKMSKDNFATSPNYGYKLHAICGISGVIHSFDLSKVSVHDIHYMTDIKSSFSNCTVIGDRGYIGKDVQLDLFETSKIELAVPYRRNQKDYKPVFAPFARARKRIETIFSQLCDQFMITRNYAKNTDGLFTRIVSKIRAFTCLQFLNYENQKPIGQVKYALI